jgi:hypothetical protein
MCGRFKRRSDQQKFTKTFAVTASLEETDLSRATTSARNPFRRSLEAVQIRQSDSTAVDWKCEFLAGQKKR